MKNLLILISTIILISGCVDQYKIKGPYKTEKVATLKAINTIGETELIRNVKLEKFELSDVVLTSEILDTLDIMIDKKRQGMVESLEERIKFNKERRDYYYHQASKERYKEMKKINSGFAKDYDKKVKEYQTELEEYVNNTDNNPLIEYYNNVKDIHLEYGDTTAKIFDVVYLIDDARTTSKYSILGKDDSTAYNLEISKKSLIEKVSNEWQKSWSKAFNK